MAFVTLNTSKLQENYCFLDKLFKENSIQWTVVSKLLCGNKLFLENLISLGIKSLCDSRVSNLKMIKKLDPNIETIYIKPPPKLSVSEIIKYADVSVNTELKTIDLLSREALKQNKKHKIIIMIEMGELREGVMREDFIDFYKKVFELPNIEVVGIGTNLTCLSGVLPNEDKLIQLSLYRQLIEAKFNKKIPLVSGGSSVTIPLLLHEILPKGVNHFRVGESLFMGTDVYNDTALEGLNTDVFRLYAEIIELIEKPMVPAGELGTNVEGESFSMESEQMGETSYRAIIDLGMLDVDSKHIKPKDNSIELVGASSDMLVVDLGDNKNKYKVGGLIEFAMDYMGVLRIMSSKYIEKRVVE
ncbi:alanine/ornithine racemase family PLP-dependent enzyme [Marinifilum sp. D737]|uniref:alanine/ornithine racemase family PLP-dependent enzyme n=1 Tax=Marinifilum sp. D737 TaxID=2969628 RepID=UPI002275F265|nr:alanine/ornithine racemase family PLP-dependent enzyme [Marinifilum sp. D737]MCY1636381.1 alanine/ornithine racemase family PLP-dependent enzyme [Marinifilum sp. D737]